MSKFPRNLVIALAVCSATAFLYLPTLLAQDASKKASPTSMKSGAAIETLAKTKKTADGTPSVPASKNATAKTAIAKYQLQLVVYNPILEEIVQWIK